MRMVILIVLAAVTASSGGCVVSRAEQLAHQSDRVETKLLRERDRVIAAKVTTQDATARLDHLSDLRMQLTVADAARKLAPRVLQDPVQVDSAYDIIEEVYSTIDWNIPLMPGESTWKPMPAMFGPAGLDFSKLTKPLSH